MSDTGGFVPPHVPGGSPVPDQPPPEPPGGQDDEAPDLSLLLDVLFDVLGDAADALGRDAEKGHADLLLRLHAIRSVVGRARERGVS